MRPRRPFLHQELRPLLLDKGAHRLADFKHFELVKAGPDLREFRL